VSDELSLPDAVARAQANLSRRESLRLIKVRTTELYKLRAKYCGLSFTEISHNILTKNILETAATITLVFYNILFLHLQNLFLLFTSQFPSVVVPVPDTALLFIHTIIALGGGDGGMGGMVGMVGMVGEGDGYVCY
jgi:hypothetical protein